MNMIGTGGYGGSSYDKFADIEWTKNKHSLTFSVSINSVNFKVETHHIKFTQNINNLQFNIQTNNLEFSVNKKELQFKVKKCDYVMTDNTVITYNELDFSKSSNSQYIGII